MDDHSIDQYLSELHRRVGTWHRDPGRVTDEAADHLMERAAALRAAGLGEREAASRAVAEYGSVDDVADAHLRSTRRPAIPTRDTRTYGAAAIVGGVGWLVLPVLAVLLPDRQPFWMLLAVVFQAAVATTVLGHVGLWQRHGGLGPLGWLATIPAVLAVPFVVFVWPIPAWTCLFGAATLLFGLAVLRRGVAPSLPSIAAASGLALSAVAVLAAEALTGRHREDFAFLASTPAVTMLLTGMGVFGLGMIGLGRWLRSEEPVELGTLPAPTRPHTA